MMRGIVLAALIAALPAQAEQDAGAVPSGLDYAPQETLFEPMGAYIGARRMVRLRFVAPELADPEQFGFAKIEADFQALCETIGLPVVAKSAPNARQIVISVSAEPVAFGDFVPNVVQYFDIFRIEKNTCIWEGL